ncbi:MAG: 2-amino-4-hydroxy-6-hydroxymethyldihydropteridine diphosphokinase [Nitrospirae bacterium]|nr:2-amino-4-hydroxy-6-hydroxymethyldihydropteridine diphosphokinase [Nitrospirota bacterium]
MLHTAFIALGSNLGDRMRNLQEAFDSLTRPSGVVLSERSPVYESEPVGHPEQGWFLNGVVRISTSFSPMDLLELCQSIEEKQGRKRSIPAGPRTIDLDILFFDEEVIHNACLILPHPRLHLRSFVLTPLVELDPEFFHPVLRKTVRQLLKELHDPHVVRKYREVSHA